MFLCWQMKGEVEAWMLGQMGRTSLRSLLDYAVSHAALWAFSLGELTPVSFHLLPRSSFSLIFRINYIVCRSQCINTCSELWRISWWWAQSSEPRARRLQGGSSMTIRSHDYEGSLSGLLPSQVYRPSFGLIQLSIQSSSSPSQLFSFISVLNATWSSVWKEKYLVGRNVLCNETRKGMESRTERRKIWQGENKNAWSSCSRWQTPCGLGPWFLSYRH